MASALAERKAGTSAGALERVLGQGDLKDLSPEERVSYYLRVCESLSLNPATRPFEYLTFQGKTILYARRDCTEQLRKRDKVSVAITSREMVEGVYVVTAKATTPDGRTDESIGAVAIEGLKGEARANAFMKAETKSKRRVTLSICGLGCLDESEVEDVPAAAVPIQSEARSLSLTAGFKHRISKAAGKQDVLDAVKRDMTAAKPDLLREHQVELGQALTAAYNSGGAKCSPAQVGLIKKLCEEKGYPVEVILEDCQADNLHGLTATEATAIIDRLNAAEKREAVAAE